MVCSVEDESVVVGVVEELVLLVEVVGKMRCWRRCLVWEFEWR